jgi:hypothetical protein
VNKKLDVLWRASEMSLKLVKKIIGQNERGILSLCLCLAVVSFAGAASAEELRPNVLDPSYQHDRFVTQPADIIRKFRAFTTSFDSDDDDDGASAISDQGPSTEWIISGQKRADLCGSSPLRQCRSE